MPTFVMVLAIIAARHALAGNTGQAQQTMQRLRQLDPALRLSAIEGWLPFYAPSDFGKFAEGLRLAGLPE